MSRIGNRSLEIPSGIKVDINDQFIVVSGGSDKLQIGYDNFFVKPELKDNFFVTKKANNSKKSREQFGTINSLVYNAFIGLTKGFTKHLEIVGVGYKASMEGTKLRLDLGYSHPIFLEIPKDVKVNLISSLELEISSFNKQSAGEFAAKIRRFRPPEPYKGKGVKYKDEIILRKVGKTSEGTKK